MTGIIVVSRVEVHPSNTIRDATEPSANRNTARNLIFDYLLSKCTFGKEPLSDELLPLDLFPQPLHRPENGKLFLGRT